ncbi:hypothetical protein [Parasitella parasitica]|uniref:Tc1-like transposase DDE domain-containing protein n=1 Tax=Parasitella parasitica TaxID=35722 RepID=A0A0B7N1W0_9FUNG|nr:hypothetical protein [Parasitella parasitica]
MDEIPVSDPMEIETVQNDLYNTVGLEWHYWGQPEISKKVAEPDVKKLMDLSSYQGFRQNISMSSETSEAHAKEKKDSKLSPVKVSNSKVRGSYRSYNPEQIQELLDLVIEGGLSARKAGMMVGIVERTAQHYVKLYRDDEEKRLPGLRKPRIKWHMKLEPQHTDFLCTFYGENPEAVLWQARESLLQAFPEIKSISLSGLHKHLVQHASLTLKKLERVVTARAAHNNLNLRKERVLEWKADKNMDWENKGCSEEGCSFEEKKEERCEHFLEFLSNVMDTLDQHGMKGRYLVMDNASIHKVNEVQNLIENRGYKATYLPPYSPFLNPIELFWSKVKGKQEKLERRRARRQKKILASAESRLSKITNSQAALRETLSPSPSPSPSTSTSTLNSTTEKNTIAEHYPSPADPRRQKYEERLISGSPSPSTSTIKRQQQHRPTVQRAIEEEQANALNENGFLGGKIPQLLLANMLRKTSPEPRRSSHPANKCWNLLHFISMVWLGILAIHEEAKAHGLNQVPKLIQNPSLSNAGVTETVHFPVFWYFVVLEITLQFGRNVYHPHLKTPEESSFLNVAMQLPQQLQRPAYLVQKYGGLQACV